MHDHLVAELDRIVAELFSELDACPHARRLLEGEVSAAEYAFYLEQTYLYVRWTRPLLRRAGERLGASQKNPALANLFLQKADEEAGHEHWALADLRALGYAPAPEPTPVPAIAAYIAWNLFTVEARSPIAFLGTAYVLEALSAARAATTAENLVTHSGIVGIEGAVRFLRGHADADEGHLAELGALLSAATTEADHPDILLSARLTRAVYAGLFSAAPLRHRDERSAA